MATLPIVEIPDWWPKGPRCDAWTRALAGNRTWAATVPPKILEENARAQNPEILWLGCSDSRMPETTIVRGLPGDIFVHRNIANILHPGDMNTTAVITFAVRALPSVQHIVVCGHTLCGGVKAALANDTVGGVLDTWLLPLRSLREQLSKDPSWAGLGTKEKNQRLMEANVRAGVRTIRRNADVIRAVQERGLKVHGAFYDIAHGRLVEVDVSEDEEERKWRLEAFETS